MPPSTSALGRISTVVSSCAATICNVRGSSPGATARNRFAVDTPRYEVSHEDSGKSRVAVGYAAAAPPYGKIEYAETGASVVMWNARVFAVPCVMGSAISAGITPAGQRVDAVAGFSICDRKTRATSPGGSAPSRGVYFVASPSFVAVYVDLEMSSASLPSSA